jgi:hypothetical protein
LTAACSIIPCMVHLIEIQFSFKCELLLIDKYVMSNISDVYDIFILYGDILDLLFKML